MTEPYFGATDQGRQRSNNEDAYVAELLPDGRLLLAVIDGVGGYEGGEVAAAIARQLLEQRGEEEALYNARDLAEAFGAINAAIAAEKLRKPQLARMACVLSAALVDEVAGRIDYAHVGDTRLYLYRDGALVKISSDHSFVGLLEDSGRISEAEAMAHPKRNEIDRALGFGSSWTDPAYVQTGSSPYLPGDGLLLCSDGLSDLLTSAEMAAVLQSAAPLPVLAQRLIEAANERGGKDNITVVLARHRGRREAATPVGMPRLATAPVEIREAGKAVVPAKQRSAPRRPLAVGMLLALLLAGWLAIRLRQRPPEVVFPDTPRKEFPRSLTFPADSLQLGADQVFLQPDTLYVLRDSLRILGNRSLMMAHRGRSVWQVAPTVQLLEWAHLELHDADVRISSSNVSAIRFDSVRLINVSIGIEQPLRFRDTVLSGVLYTSVQKGGKRHE